MPIDSQENVDLWVCPHCDILGGIEIRIDDGNIITNCLSCGFNLKFDEVKFLTESLVRKLNMEILQLFPTEIHEDIRFSWVSNKTLGLIFSIPYLELMEVIAFDISEVIEELSEKHDMIITVYYE
ncbi:MAG: hypothetical protein GPJ54_10545 [Candidatus Heimdallarchaeota archaeon]|nr:hypothetical protein [Candidatus Heimdallarchaeota archaeon]